MSKDRAHKVVIAGGGAGGLELAAKLGRKFGPAHVYLVDKASDHIWKPSLHEVAAGTLDIHREGLSYFMLAKDCGFTFLCGEIDGIDRLNKTISLKAMFMPQGEPVFPARHLAYDTLVLAIGSKSNFFGTPGAAEFAIALDSTQQAERFRLKLLHQMAILNQQNAAGAERKLTIAIVGGGATGVELAAELLEACRDAVFYGWEHLNVDRDVRITLLEGSDRILSALPPRLSASARKLLEEKGVVVNTSVRVAQVLPDALVDADGNHYAADLCVWAAGIEAPALLSQLELPVNRMGQLVVDARLRAPDESIYAMGDCAQAPWNEDGRHLPARAQVAHQQADYLLPQLAARIRQVHTHGKPFVFRDYGSLVSIGHSRGVGSLMGVLSGKSWFVEGLLARTMYMSLHLMHHWSVLGPLRTVTVALGRLLLKRGAPRVKLH
ncbi:MAG: NAD(P)/FAD-dependent oxidoreductase [Candidimonas sp.]